jgi:uncharacterized membrane protein
LSTAPRKLASNPSEFAPILIVTLVTLVIAYATKQACFMFGAGESFYCFSDYGPVYSALDLTGGRFPYTLPAIEYPVGLGLVVWLAAAVTHSAADFARVNMLFASAAALAIAWILWRDTGRRAFLFAAAPTLAMYAFLNWDLVALVLAIAAISAFRHHRDLSAGLLLGLGAAAKAFPLLLLVPLVAERLRANDRRAAARVAIATMAPIAALNIPVAWGWFEGWSHVFRFSSTRPVDWGTLWSVGCQATGTTACADVPFMNTLTLAAFLAGSVIAWVLVTRTAPRIPRWQLGLPILVVFFLTNKVYSPQYSLWILPWFALVLPSVRWFLIYAIVDIGIYVTTFGWQQHLAQSGGLPLWPLNLFVLARAAILIGMLVAFARRAAASGDHAAVEMSRH